MAKSNSTMPLLGLILAIPAVACYVWWTHLNAQTKQQLTMRVRGRTDGVRFGGAPDRNKLSNPIVSGFAAAAVASSGPAAGLPAAAAPAAAAASAAPVPAPSPMTAAQVPAQAAQEVATAGQVVISRDPMMSPFDAARLRQIEDEKEQARRELENEAARNRPRKRREPPIEARVELQGIVSTERGNRAIVNGDTVSVGDSVVGAKVVRITGQTVVFAYKGRRFSKSISK